MKKILLYLLILGIIGCDVPGVLEIKNELNKEIEISYSNQGEQRIDSINTGIIQPNKKGIIAFGFGTRWNDSFIENYPKNILDTLTIKVGDTEYYCSSEKCKKEIINRANRKSKRKMSITINSKLIDKSFKNKVKQY